MRLFYCHNYLFKVPLRAPKGRVNPVPFKKYVIRFVSYSTGLLRCAAPRNDIANARSGIYCF